MESQIKRLQDSLGTIASEAFRFQKVFDKMITKLSVDERGKYQSQFAWFTKKVNKALEEAGMNILNLEGEQYDPGMAVTPLNIDDFDVDEDLTIIQMLEPIIMHGDMVHKTGTVILGRKEE